MAFEGDYEEIEAAVMETARGRWFLSEFASRNRVAETRVLLDAIGRLERNASPGAEGERASRLARLEDALRSARARLAELGLKGGAGSSGGMAALVGEIVRTGAAATADVLDAAEKLQEASWALRERGAEPRICDEVDRRATSIYTACAFHELSAARLAVLVEMLGELEAALAGAPEPRLPAVPSRPAGPALDGDAEPRFSLDVVGISAGSLEPREVPEVVAETEPVRLHRADEAAPTALSLFDALDFRDKLRLFT